MNGIGHRKSILFIENLVTDFPESLRLLHQTDTTNYTGKITELTEYTSHTTCIYKHVTIWMNLLHSSQSHLKYLY